MPSNRASVLMVVLWILAILVIFAVGLGHRTAVFLSLAKYQKDRLAAFYLAKAAVNLAIQELTADNTRGCDCLNDNWADNEKVFKNIFFNEDKDNFASVSYSVKGRDAGENKTIYGVMDEDRKISISTTSPLGRRKLSELFKFMGLTENEAEGLKNIFVDWMSPGNGRLKTLEEALVILEYFYQKKGEYNYQGKAQEAFSRFKDLATIYSEDNRLNLNTVSEEVLAILAGAIAEDDAQKRSAPALVSAILSLRQTKNCFTDLDELNEAIDSGNQNQVKLLEALKANLKLTSSVFKIEATAKVKNVVRNIAVIYQRNSKSIIGWHQSN